MAPRADYPNYLGRMTRAALVALLLNVALIATWIVLRETWFPGSIGCDDSSPPRPANCDTKGDVLVWLGGAEMAVLVVTGAWFAGRGWLRGRNARTSTR